MNFEYNNHFFFIYYFLASRPASTVSLSVIYFIIISVERSFFVHIRHFSCSICEAIHNNSFDKCEKVSSALVINIYCATTTNGES